jgi:hypothetical protein
MAHLMKVCLIHHRCHSFAGFWISHQEPPTALQNQSYALDIGPSEIVQVYFHHMQDRMGRDDSKLDERGDICNVLDHVGLRLKAF